MVVRTYLGQVVASTWILGVGSIFQTRLNHELTDGSPKAKMKSL